jgi:hypothetical protein
VDVGTHDQLLLLGLPARRRPGEDLSRRDVGLLQPRGRDFRGLFLHGRGVPRPAPLWRRRRPASGRGSARCSRAT